MLIICPSVSSFGVAVRVGVRSLLGVRLADKVPSGEVVSFDVKARMEEKERRSGLVSVGFALSMVTKPSVVKFEVEGVAILEGANAEIDRMLEVDPETQVPFVFQRVYQHVFMSMYLLATLIDAPPPPPNLLFSGQQQQVPQVQLDKKEEAAATPEAEVAEEAAAVQESKAAQSEEAKRPS